ncbi:MAG: hypothetical protein OHK0038_20290 [Flammeovirgaceae bacterium]
MNTLKIIAIVVVAIFLFKFIWSMAFFVIGKLIGTIVILAIGYFVVKAIFPNLLKGKE